MFIESVIVLVTLTGRNAIVLTLFRLTPILPYIHYFHNYPVSLLCYNPSFFSIFVSLLNAMNIIRCHVGVGITFPVSILLIDILSGAPITE